MRLKADTDGHDHDGLVLTGDDHHSESAEVAIEDTTTSIPPSSTFNLDITLPDGSFELARVIINGGKQMSGNQWRECCEVHATRDSGEAVGHSVEDVAFKKVYAVTYSKQNADAYLSHKIFDNNLSYILLQDAVLTGSVLRLTFLNTFGGSTFLWVKGQAVLF